MPVGTLGLIDKNDIHPFRVSGECHANSAFDASTAGLVNMPRSWAGRLNERDSCISGKFAWKKSSRNMPSHDFPEIGMLTGRALMVHGLVPKPRPVGVSNAVGELIWRPRNSIVKVTLRARAVRLNAAAGSADYAVGSGRGQCVSESRS